MKKILIASMVIAGLWSHHSLPVAAESEPLIQMNASSPSEVQAKPKPKLKVKTRTHVAHVKTSKKKHIRPSIKTITVKIEKNHVDIDKMIEYNNFEDADRLIEKALNNNPKDIQVRALWAVSLAKQYKLDPAQKELNALLKTYPKNADLHYAQGVVYYKRTTSSNMAYVNNTQKLLEDALKEFKTAISLDKEDYRAYNAAGVVELMFGENKEAKDLFTKSVNINPNYATAIDNLGTMDFAEGKLDDAEKKFNKALSYNSHNPTAMGHLAQVAMRRQDYSKAINYLNNALAINSNSHVTYNLMGEAYQKQGNEAAAINAYKKSVMIKPEFAQPYLNLAGVYEKRGDSEFAIEQLKTALSVSPSASRDFYNAKLKLADISLSSGKYQQAIDNYSALVGVKDYNDDALKGLASVYFEQAQASSSKALLGLNQELFKAYDCINKAVVVNNQDLELHLAKLKLAKITNQPEASKKILEEIIQTPDGDLVNTVIKGEAYLTLSDYSNAQKSFDTATTLTKNTEDDLYLAEIFLYQKQYDEAEKVLQNVLKKEPTNQQALNDLDYIAKSKKYAENCFETAQSYLKSKNKNAAIEYLSQSLSLNPNNSDAQLYLARLLEQQKDYQGASSHYKAYLGLAAKPLNQMQIKRKIRREEEMMNGKR